MSGKFLGYLEKTHTYVKSALATFWKKIWLLFTPTSGHTEFGIDESRQCDQIGRLMNVKSNIIFLQKLL